MLLVLKTKDGIEFSEKQLVIILTNKSYENKGVIKPIFHSFLHLK